MKRVIFMACLVVLGGVFALNEAVKAQDYHYALSIPKDIYGLGGFTLLIGNDTNDTSIVIGDDKAIFPFGVSTGLGSCSECDSRFLNEGGDSSTGNYDNTGDWNITGEFDLLYDQNTYARHYIGSTGNYVIDNSLGTGANEYFDLRPGDDNWGIILRSYNNPYMYANFYMHAGYQDYLQIIAGAPSSTKGLTIGTGTNQHVGINTVPSALYMLDVQGDTETSSIFLTDSGDSILLNGDICYTASCSTTFIDFGSGVVDIYSGQSNNPNIKIRSTAIIINENGNPDDDFRVEGDTDQYLLFVDSGADAVGIGNATPTEKLSVGGNVTADDYLINSPTSNFENVNVMDYLHGWEDYIKPDGSYAHELDYGFYTKDVQYNYTEEIRDKNGTLINTIQHEGTKTINETSIWKTIEWLRELTYLQNQTIQNLENRIKVLESAKP